MLLAVVTSDREGSIAVVSDNGVHEAGLLRFHRPDRTEVTAVLDLSLEQVPHFEVSYRVTVACIETRVCGSFPFGSSVERRIGRIDPYRGVPVRPYRGVPVRPYCGVRLPGRLYLGYLGHS